MTELGRLVVGIDIGGTKSLGVALDAASAPLTGEVRRGVLARCELPTPRGTEALVATVRAILGALVADGAPAAVGVGVAGLVTRAGVLRVGPNLPGALEWPVAVDVGALVPPGTPVTVVNDATAATFGEWRCGAGRGLDDVAVITLGTGMGGGIVSGGRIMLGANGFAGEPGHMVVVPDGVACVCGQRGCWERYASGAALARFGADAGLVASDGRTLRGEDVVAAAAAGDARARVAFRQLAEWTARGIANLVNLLDPARVVVGGGLVRAADHFLPEVGDLLGMFLYGAEHRPVPPVVAAELGADAGAIGAALLALPWPDAGPQLGRAV